jgi:thiamine biosynthesis protein ThiS
MQLTINGICKKFSTQLTVQQLLVELGLSPERVVVELNRNILTTEKHSSTELKSGDTIELVQFVGGG